MSLRQQFENSGGIIYMTTYFDDTPLSSVFMGASPESLEAAANALRESAADLRKAQEEAKEDEPKIILDS